ncbi:restriction endonuclease [Deinococcus psychrotolerans]|uniref:Restriction endonuclease n=1 Tax=Deinococcus psychrotolerans TaxID=2489213 RepID=A0A3G8YD17_9DEIO|nr:restriction endonuclease [Deinococcus psychrotolerans]AZI43212.1 restriction endonuclease [Deinococcus psychrotolerans]
MSSNKARTSWFPLYSSASTLYKLLNGQNVAEIDGLREAIAGQMGTLASPVNWSEPDAWITERLTGKQHQQARRVWEDSGKTFNPRYMDGELALAKNFQLLAEQDGKYVVTQRGQQFQRSKSDVLRHIDEEEGVVALLLALSGSAGVKRKALLAGWLQLLSPAGELRTESTMMGKLYERLNNVIARGLVRREGQKYELTGSGKTYADTFQSPDTSLARQLKVLAQEYEKQQRELLRSLLSKMHPYRFEHLVAGLLEAMDYSDVTVTKQSGDKGIDVVATARFGITTVKELVQVKRVAGTTGAPVISQLRGSLHTQNAIKGMVITLGTFSKEAKEMAFPLNAAPITLIDGETLLDLLLEYKIGVTSTTLNLLAVESAFFADTPPTQEAAELI